jgi:hypothetical protein
LLIDSDTARYLDVRPCEPLGVASARPASDWHGTLERGQVLFLYTDGAIDERERGPVASMEELAAVALDGDTTHPDGVCERVVQMLPLERIDDVALLGLRLAP